MKIILCILVLVTLSFSAEIGRYSNGRAVGRVVNGKNAKAGEVPYIVSYQQNTIGRWERFCGGAIISPTHILTAAHCITDISPNGRFRIVAGTVVLSEDNKSRQDIGVVGKVVHPLKKNGTGPNDIAILKLESPLKMSDFVKIVNLPRAGTVATGNAVLSGWGSTNRPMAPYYLQTVTVPILPNIECFEVSKKWVKGNYSNPFSLEANICTGPLTGGYSACDGDSGGPLVQNGTLLGIVSWGETPCGKEGSISVYNKVENFISFIRANVPDLPK